MKEHSERLKKETDKQKELYQQALSQLQMIHDQKIADIQKK